MNILILNWRDISNPKSGGAEIVTFEHAKGWVKAGHEVTWFTSKFFRSANKELIDGVEIVRKGNFLTVYFFAPFYYFFSGKKFDLVIDEIHGLPFFTPLYVKKAKIAFIHEVAAEIWDFMYPFPINKVGKFIEKIYFKFYKNVLFWTDAKSTISVLESYGINRSNCTAIPCACVNSHLDRPFIKKEKNPTFIFVSRIVKMKGVEEVIKAFSFILRENNRARLWIVGEGNEKYLEKLRAMINEYEIKDKTKFYGRVNNDKKLDLMKKAHILLHASVREGWGLVVIEAAGQSTPSIVYDVTGLKDTVKNGLTGKVLDENSPYEMAKESLLLLRDHVRYIKYQRNGLIWAKSLRWKIVVKKSLSMIESVVSINK